MKNKVLYITIGLLVLVGIFLFTTYNGLVKKDEYVKLQWNEVQNAYQRRLDLIPNIVNVVKGGAEYEQTVLQQVTEARANAIKNTPSNISGTAFQQQSKAQDALASAANRLIISVEKYPDIKGTRAFSDLQVQLEGTERRIKVARADFNIAIATYNSSVRSFPTSLVAGMFGFPAKEGFQADAGADKNVEVKF